VDIFFALSGYLITGILLGLRGKPRPYATFYARRTIRIFPPYFLFTFVILAAALIAHNDTVLTPLNLGKQFLFLQGASQKDPAFLASWFAHPLRQIAHLPSLFLHAHHLPPDGIAIHAGLLTQSQTYWSLSSEEYFYLLWAPVVLRLPRRFVVLVGAAVCLVEMLLRWSWGDHGAYFGVCFRFDALLYGAFLALLLEHWRRTRVPGYAAGLFSALFFVSVAALALILYALRPIAGREVRESPLFLVFGLPLISLACTGLIGLLVLRARSAWWLCRFLRTRFMQMIGRVSYTMYLVEILGLMFAVRIFAPLGSRFPEALSVAEAIIGGLITVALAKLSWRFLESPLLRWKDRRFPTPAAAEPPAE
jgi:peptidoglycan/LPS O-acetylase OafA/YrhL